MNKFSIPAFVEELTPDAANAKYSKAKLKIYYVGETVDKRLFTKEFSDKLLSTIAYTPVVGFYSVADEDFVGHNNVQNIYGLVPESATLEYVEDAAQGVTFAVTDIILYTGRPDDTGVIASKIVGKQHSLELDPNSVQYKINRDEAGNFKNLEFTAGELIGLSVLGDNDTPAFSGSEFFSAVELPDFITDENKSKYQALFSAMFNVEPTAEEVVTEIYRTLESQRIYGYVCEHKPEQYVVICSDYGVYTRYQMSRDEEGALQLALECSVRGRYLSDEEIEVLANAKNGATEIFEDGNQTQTEPAAGTEATEDSNSTASVDSGTVAIAAADGKDKDEDEDNDKSAGTEPDDDKEDEEFEALRSSCERLEARVAELNATIEQLSSSSNQAQEKLSSLQTLFKENIINCYSHLLDAETIEKFTNGEYSVEELATGLADAYAALKTDTDSMVFEISNIDNGPSTYNEYDEAAVVQKYKNMNRGKN